MINNKNSEIILCSGIKLDKNYENVVSYNEEQLLTICRANQIYRGEKYAIVQPNRTINVAARYEDCIYANYMAFINPRYGNKWIFAWVTKVELLNPNTTQITFKVDVFSTWYSRFNINQAFIEREHVSNDTVGLHTIPEGLELGDYITQASKNEDEDYLNDMFYLANTYIVASVSELGLPLATPVMNKIYNGIPSGLLNLVFKNARELDKYIRNTEENNSSDVVYSVFIIPKSIVEIPEADFVTIPSSDDVPYSFEMAYMPDSNYETDMGRISILKPMWLDADYVPKNKKLLTFPYCFFNITNNVGEVKDYQYELFNSSQCGFTIKGAVGVGCSIRMYPINYSFKGEGTSQAENKLHPINAGKLPTCSWISDSYTNWLTANAVNIGLQAAKDITQIGISAITGSPSGAIGGLSGIANTMASVYEHSLQPASAKGGVNQGDLIFARRNTFNVYPMSIRKEYAIIIDQYFSRFGYKVNEVKTPNLLSRQVFNFIKVGGMDELISGNIPANDLEEINNIFRKGVTIYHDYSKIGNYTIDNPIINN